MERERTRVIYVSTTKRCNLKCPGCSVGIDKRVSEGIDFEVGVDVLDQEGEWTVNGLLRALEKEVELAKGGEEMGGDFSLEIKWAGGEPLFRWDLIKEAQSGLRDLAEKFGLKIEQIILTNGLLLNRRADEIVELVEETKGWSEWNVAVSLWAWGEENFRKRGRPDIKEGFELIKQGVRRLYEGGVSFNLQHTFGPWGEADDLVEFVKHLWDVEAEDYLGRDEEGKFWYVDEKGKPMPFRLSLAFWRKQEGFLTSKETLRMWIQAKRLLDWLEQKIVVEGKWIKSFQRFFTYLWLRNGDLDFAHPACDSGDIYWAIEPKGDGYRRVRCHEGLYGRNPEWFGDPSFVNFRDGGDGEPITWIFPDKPEFKLAMQLGGRGCPNEWMRVKHDEEAREGYERWKRVMGRWLVENGLWQEEWNDQEFQPPLPMTIVYASLMPKLLILAYVNGDGVEEIVRQVFFPEFDKGVFAKISGIHREMVKMTWRFVLSGERKVPSKRWWKWLDREIGRLSEEERIVLGDLMGLRGRLASKRILGDDMNPKLELGLLIDWAKENGVDVEVFSDEIGGELIKGIFVFDRIFNGFDFHSMTRKSRVSFGGIKTDKFSEILDLGNQLKERGVWRFFLRDRLLWSLTTVLSLVEMERLSGNGEMITLPMVVFGGLGLLMLLAESNDYRATWWPSNYSLEKLAAKMRGGDDEKVELMVHDFLNEHLYGLKTIIIWTVPLGMWLLTNSLMWGGESQEKALAVGLLGALSVFLDRGLSILIGGKARIGELISGAEEMKANPRVAWKLTALDISGKH